MRASAVRGLGNGRVDVSTLTPVRDEERHVRAAVSALQAQDFAGATEFLFIDGRSTDATRAILEELARADPRIRILDNPARHTAAALNVGLRAARGEFVARIDAHAVYPPSYLRLGIERLRRGDVAWVAGPPVPVGGDPFSRRVALALSSPLATGGSNHWASDLDRRAAGDEVELGTGVFAGVWRREVLERLGGWDEGWPINQDSELAARVRMAGGRIVSLPAMAATYTPRGSLPALGRQYFRYGAYRARTALRHPETVRPAHLAMPALVTVGTVALVPGRAGHACRRLLGAYAALVGLAGARAGRRSPADAAVLPAVFATMHAAWGAGYLGGLLRFGATTRPQPRPASAARSRLLVYTDYVYRRDAAGRVHAPRAFALFVAALRPHFDTLTVAGRLDPQPGRAHYRLPAGVSFVALPYYESAASPRSVAAAARGSLREFDRALRSADVAWVLGPQPLALAFAALARVRGKRLVLGVRQDLRAYVRARHPQRPHVHLVADALDAGFRALGRAAPVAAVGPALADDYRHARAVLPLTVSLVERRQLEQGQPARTWDGAELVVLSVGRLEREKNPLLLADVLSRLRAQDPRWRLVVCGEGPLEGELRARLARLGVARAAELRGYVPAGDALAAAYREAHAFLHVSWTEGVPQVLLEAFAAGLPLVATSVGGVADAVGDAGLLVAPGDPGAAAARLLEVAADPELRRRLVAAGLRRARAHTLEAETARLGRFLEAAAA